MRYFGDAGNKAYAVSYRTNGLSCGLQYGSKEGTTPVVSSPAMQLLVDGTPPWEERSVDKPGIGPFLLPNQVKKRPLHDDHMFPITYKNVLKASLHYRARKGISSTQLEDTLNAMVLDNWFFDQNLLKNGIPAPIYDEFTARIAGGTSFTPGRISMMRVTTAWQSF